MRYRLSLAAAAVIYGLPNLAFAHGGQTTGHDQGGGLLWVYAAVLVGILGLVAFRIYRRSSRPPDSGSAQRLAELEAALASNLATLRDAEDYPSECGLNAKERQAVLDDGAAIRRLIEEEKLTQEPDQDGAQTVTT